MNPNYQIIVKELISYHQIIRSEFKKLIVQAIEVEQNCKSNPDVPKGITDFIIKFWVTLEADMQKEESHVFPILLADYDCESLSSIREILDGHIEQEEELRELMQKVETYQISNEDDDVWVSFCHNIKRVVKGINKHMSAEDKVLFDFLEAGKEKRSSYCVCS